MARIYTSHAVSSEVSYELLTSSILKRRVTQHFPSQLIYLLVIQTKAKTILLSLSHLGFVLHCHSVLLLTNLNTLKR